MSNHLLNYQQVQAAIKQKHFDLIQRTQKMVTRYEKDKAEILETWPSLEEYCQHKFLLAVDTTLRQNEYPYHLDEDCLHFTLWTTNQNMSLNEAKKYVQQYHSNFVIWENPESKKSIRVKHFQIIAKIN